MTGPGPAHAPTPPAAGTHGADDPAAVDLLQRMIEIPSLSGDEGALAAFLVERMRGMGLDAFVDEAGNAVGLRGMPASGGSWAGVARAVGEHAPTRVDLALLGHMDTVPGTIPVRLDDGVLHGRGAVDAKGPLAAFIVAAATANLPPGFRIAVIGATEEEAASSKGARHAAGVLMPERCLIGEPSGWDGVTLGYKGRLLAELLIQTPGSHSAGPDPTAAELACQWWNRVREGALALNGVGSGIFDQVQPRLRAIRSEHDGLHEHASARVGFRLPPGVSPHELEALCRDAAAGLPGVAALSFEGHEFAVRAARDTDLVRALTTAVRREGGRPRLVVKTGTSDMNVVAPAWRCPIAAYGPGDSTLDHTPHERIAISEYRASIRVLRHAIESLAGV
jgi:LysW-gamma-L-lysine carboxypeptidase